MSPMDTFYVALVYRAEPDGTQTVRYIRGAITAAEEALNEARDRALPGDLYEVRSATRRAYDRWVLSGAGHALPVHGTVVTKGLRLPLAS